MFQIENKIQNYKWAKRTKAIEDITIHHFASTDKYTWKNAEADHKRRGWPGCVYTYVINVDGSIIQVNNDTDITFHNGFNNSVAISIALQGNTDIKEPTSKQLMSLIFLILDIKSKHKSIVNLMGHKEYKNSTACPGKFIYMDLLRQLTKLKKR